MVLSQVATQKLQNQWFSCLGLFSILLGNFGRQVPATILEASIPVSGLWSAQTCFHRCINYTSVGSHLSPCCNPTCSTQDSMGPPCFILASLYTVNHRSIPGPPKWPEFDSTFESFPDVDCSARSIDPVVTGSDCTMT
jgi:hypothetical protein